MTYSKHTVKELQELRDLLYNNTENVKELQELRDLLCYYTGNDSTDFNEYIYLSRKLDEVCEELKLRSEQQKEKMKNLCEQLAK